jgi:hypothetical protein
MGRETVWRRRREELLVAMCKKMHGCKNGKNSSFWSILQAILLHTYQIEHLLLSLGDLGWEERNKCENASAVS